MKTFIITFIVLLLMPSAQPHLKMKHKFEADITREICDCCSKNPDRSDFNAIDSCSQAILEKHRSDLEAAGIDTLSTNGRMKFVNEIGLPAAQCCQAVAEVLILKIKNLDNVILQFEGFMKSQEVNANHKYKVVLKNKTTGEEKSFISDFKMIPGRSNILVATYEVLKDDKTKREYNHVKGSISFK